MNGAYAQNDIDKLKKQMEILSKNKSHMTMRDYFAVHAMQTYQRENYLDEGCKRLAMLSYEMADAMLTEREGK